MALMNEVDHSKDVEGRLKGLQAEFEAKAATMDKNSVEYQRMAFDFAIRGYEMMGQAYDEKSSNYGNIMGIGAAAAAIGGVELMITPPICSKGGSIAAVIGGGIMMAMAGSLKGEASKAAASNRQKAGKLTEITEMFDKYHNNTIRNEEDTLAERMGGAGGSSKDSMNISGGGTGSTKTSGESKNNVGTLSSSGAKRPNSCLSSDGKVDSSCSCRAKDTCMKQAPPKVTITGTKQEKVRAKKALSQASSGIAMKSIYRNFNSVSNGKRGLYDWSRNNKRRTAQRLKYSQKVLKKLNNMRRKVGAKEIKFDKAFIKKYAKSKGAGAVVGVNFEESQRSLREESTLEKDLLKNITKYKKLGSWRKPLLFDKKVFDPNDLFDEDVDAGAGNAVAAGGELLGKGKDSKPRNLKKLSPDMLIRPNQDIFGVISKRYRKVALKEEWINKED